VARWRCVCRLIFAALCDEKVVVVTDYLTQLLCMCRKRVFGVVSRLCLGRPGSRFLARVADVSTKREDRLWNPVSVLLNV